VKQPFLYEVKKDEVKFSVFGIFHKGVGFNELPSSVHSRLENSKSLVFAQRTDYCSDGLCSFTEYGLSEFLDEGESLEDILGQDAWSRLLKIFPDKQPKHINRWSPVMALYYLREVRENKKILVASMNMDRMKKAMLAEILEMSHALGLHMVKLENLRPLSAACSVKLVQQGSRVVNSQIFSLRDGYDSFYDYRAAYYTGEEEVFAKTHEMFFSDTCLLGERAKDRLTLLIENPKQFNNAFFALPASSLVVPGGLLERLRGSGFEVEKVIQN
jgi:hypothetical protein